MRFQGQILIFPYFLVTSGPTDINNLTSVATETTVPRISPSVPTNESNEETTTLSISGNTSSHFLSQEGNETTPAISGNQKYSASIAYSPTTDRVTENNALCKGIFI